MALHWAIAADLAARPVEHSVLIHLGDYVDRGPDSAGVLWLLAGDVAPQVTTRVDLRGNHEVMMLDALSGARGAAGGWLDNGGEATLESYGFAIPAAVQPEAWRRALPAAHAQFLGGLATSHAEGNYLFVHAGIRPGIPPGAQSARDLLWIREPFLSSLEPRDFVVVHGHTPVPHPAVTRNRIGIDTGAAMGGVLTCAVLEDDSLRFMTA